MRNSQILMFTGALLLLSLFVLPMWQITLGAPQYPDPLGMNIWINKITDMNPHDLKNINLMNHYIGMNPIPETIPEFRFFPYIIGFMIILGVLFGLNGNRKLYLTWFIMMSLLGILGMYDFWLWEYNYGHKLHSDAAIKFVDDIGNPMSYQPPLIGKKTILNFRATSFPSIGAYLLSLGMMISLTAFFIAKNEKTSKKRKKLHINKKQKIKLAATFLLLGTLISCSIKQKEINYGSDNCHYCKMLIVDKQHATEIVTQKGKIYTYDSIECMLNEMSREDAQQHKLYLTNVFNTPSKLYNAEECSFLISESLPSPMGEYLTAFNTKKLALETKTDIGGKIYNWNEIKEKFNVMY